MWENRICYLLFGLVVAVLLFQFSQPFLLCLLICLVVLALFMAIALRREAANLTVSLRTSPGGQVGKQLYASVTATAGHRLLAARSVLMEVELANITTGYTKRQRFLLPLSGRKSTFNLPLDVEQCGRTVLKCSTIVVRDQFNLFCAPTAPFGEVYTVIYPSSVDVDVTLSRASTRAPRGDGLMQNRKGGDPSEMYDIREYQPGDDIRAIHWKLSSKTDALILRQASDPAHFNVAIMPDFGRNVDGKPTDPKTLNAAIAYGSALGSELVRQGVPFCMAIPNGSGLDLYEVRTPREHEQMLARWLSTPVQENSGDGLKYFLMEHLDAQFTRLMILAADGYSMDLNRVDGRITATVLNAVLGAGGTHAVMNSSCDFMELPVEPSDRDNCRILC